LIKSCPVTDTDISGAEYCTSATKKLSFVSLRLRVHVLVVYNSSAGCE
jgi:hypothetical protein